MPRPFVLTLSAAALLVFAVACTARARSALVPAVRVRGVAQRRWTEGRRRWDHAVHVSATFRTQADPRPLPPAPSEPPSTASLPRRLACRSARLCRWEARARHAALTTHPARTDR